MPSFSSLARERSSPGASSERASPPRLTWLTARRVYVDSSWLLIVSNGTRRHVAWRVCLNKGETPRGAYIGGLGVAGALFNTRLSLLEGGSPSPWLATSTAGRHRQQRQQASPFQ